MKTPLVSVIVPTYNRADMVKRAIQSILDQSFDNYEILIIDDASTDNTEETIKKMDNDKIVYVGLEKNVGQCRARNIGIRKAKGKYIGFLDSDDEWMPTKLEKQLRIFNQTDDPDLGAVYTGYLEIDEIKKKHAVKNGNFRKGKLYKDFLSGFCPATPTMFLVKKEALDKVEGFDENLPTFVDYDLWLRIAKLNYSFDYVPEPLIRKYEHQGHQMAKDINKRLAGLDILFDKWGEQMLQVSGKKSFHKFRKAKIEALVRSVLDKPGSDIRKNALRSIGLLSSVHSRLLTQYLKALLFVAFGKSIESIWKK